MVYNNNSHEFYNLIYNLVERNGMSYNILIIGGTGSLGSELTRYYNNEGWNVTVLSRDGHKQQKLNMELPKVQFVLGDVCDEKTMRFALGGQHFVVNCAAQKIVHQGEKFVDEFIRVNIDGGLNVARCCYDMDIFNVLQISSDKACEPINLYGKTKAVSEDIFRSYGFSSLRYGNVVNSNGSFWSIWKQQIANGDKITIRTPYPTRFILTIKDAVALVDDALSLLHNLDAPSIGSVYVPHSLSAFSIDSVARALGIVDWIEKPLLSGEKVHEKLVADIETGYKISNLLMDINKEGIGNLKHEDFNSNTVKRITGKAFLATVGGLDG